MKKDKNIRIREMYIAYKPIYQELYSCAYVITGNERKSEEAVMKVMLLNPYPEQADIRELTRCIKERAIKDAKAEEGEYFSVSGTIAETLSPLAESILTFSEDETRVLLMKYALGLKIREISSVTGKRIQAVKEILAQAVNQAYSYSNSEKGVYKALRGALNEIMDIVCIAPDYNNLIRSAEAKIESEKTPDQYRKKIRGFMSAVFASIFLAFAAIIIWLSVLLLDYYRESYINPRTSKIQTQAAEEHECRYWKV